MYLWSLKQVSNDISLHAESEKKIYIYILTLTVWNYLVVDFFLSWILKTRKFLKNQYLNTWIYRNDEQKKTKKQEKGGAGERKDKSQKLPLQEVGGGEGSRQRLVMEEVRNSSIEQKVSFSHSYCHLTALLTKYTILCEFESPSVRPVFVLMSTRVKFQLSDSSLIVLTFYPV